MTVEHARDAALPSEPLAADLELSLRTTWNARLVEYDAARFPFAAWALDEVRRAGYAIESLDALHEVVPEQEVYVLSKQLCDATNAPAFRELLQAFIRDVLVPQGDLQGVIAAQRFLNVRIMLPQKPHGVFPFHTGLLYGHGPASRSLWMPLTDVSRAEDRSGSMQIIPLERSRELIEEATRAELSIDEMTELFAAESHQVAAGPGQVCLFSQENIHGNFVNETGKTRVSIDFRLAEARFGDQLARKIPGGYFEILPEAGEEPVRASQVAAGDTRSRVIYLNNNTESTRAVPPHLQRHMIYDYCRRHDVSYDFELFELETLAHLPTLMHIVTRLGCSPILYSIYALPEERERRREVYEAAIASGVVLYFVNEDLAVRALGDIDRVEAVLDFAKYGA